MSNKPLSRRLTDFGSGGIATPLYALSSAIAFAIVWVSTKNELPPTDLPIPTFVLALALAVAIMVIGSSLGGFFSRRHKKVQQQLRDDRAREILELAGADTPPDYSLYLRAFETTGRMPREASSSMNMPGFDARTDDDRLNDFETALAECVENGIPMVALGEPGEHIGAGRVSSTEDCWKDSISLLASSAAVIFLLPSTRPGTQWEIDFLRSNRLFKKTIFAAPSRKSRWTVLSRDREDYDWEGSWETLRRAMSEKAVEFPEYDKNGQLFSLGRDGRLLVRTSLKGHVDGRYIRPFFKKHLERMRKETVATQK